MRVLTPLVLRQMVELTLDLVLAVVRVTNHAHGLLVTASGHQGQ
jgi:hypothetical protein